MSLPLQEAAQKVAAEASAALAAAALLKKKEEEAKARSEAEFRAAKDLEAASKEKRSQAMEDAQVSGADMHDCAGD